MDVSELQKQIDNALDHLRPAEIVRIWLSEGSNVTDLTSCVDVEVVIGDGRREIFSIVTQNFLDRLLNKPRSAQSAVIDTSFHTSGRPLTIAKTIAGDIIVRGILKYITMERRREWESPQF